MKNKNNGGREGERERERGYLKFLENKPSPSTHRAIKDCSR